MAAVSVYSRPFFCTEATLRNAVQPGNVELSTLHIIPYILHTNILRYTYILADILTRENQQRSLRTTTRSLSLCSVDIHFKRRTAMRSDIARKQAGTGPFLRLRCGSRCVRCFVCCVCAALCAYSRRGWCGRGVFVCVSLRLLYGGSLSHDTEVHGDKS